MEKPIVCFGERLHTFLPTRSLAARMSAARSLASRVNGRVVFFCWDSWHRGWAGTLLPNGNRVDFEYYSKVQRDFTPFYLKKIDSLWWGLAEEELRGIVPDSVTETLSEIRASLAGDFCLRAYKRLGFLKGVDVLRSSSPEVRARAKPLEDFYVEVPFRGDIVKARYSERAFLLETEPPVEIFKTSVLPEMVTPVHANAFEWMDSVITPKYYLLAGDERVKESDFPWISFVRARDVEDPDQACWSP